MQRTLRRAQDRLCANAWCKAAFEVSDEDLVFLDKVSPVIGGKKFTVPPPTLCPDCRTQRRLGHVNRTNLYKRKSTWSGEEIISIYSAEKNIKVYENEIWWSDAWDPFEYGREADLLKPVVPQLQKLFEDVPYMALLNDQNENCPYVNTTGWAKNCHLCYGADYSEDCYYGEAIYYSKNSVDCLHGQNLERCYECTDCNDSYGLQFSQNCNNCSDSLFLFDCIGCKHCFGCVGLRQKEYYYFNEKLNEEEYVRRTREHEPFTVSAIMDVRAALRTLELQCPHKSFIGTNNEHVSGDYLFHSKNAFWCFDSDELHDCKYSTNTRKAKDCQDVNFWGHPGELLYECLAVGEGATNALFCYGVWGGTENMLYCSHCIACRNCFGCAGLRHKQYCILNRQYSKEEYEHRMTDIITHMQKTGEWGEFLPLTASLHDYQESLAQRFFPLSKEEAQQRGWKWRDIADDIPTVRRTIRAEELPDRISDVPDDILHWAIFCETTGRPFRIIKPELEFYREHSLPVPHRHPDERLKNRWALRNPRKLWTRDCAKCGKQIQTTYQPSRPEVVYCEECYLQEVY